MFLFLLGVLLIIGVLAFGYFYLFTNTIALGGPDLSRWQVSGDFAQVSDGQYRWNILYEPGGPSVYRGSVRHATPDRMGLYPLLTHDILVTSGDFADPALVSTRVDILLHRFYWQAKTARQPLGKINLIHAVPLNAEVYRLLLKIRPGDQVVISGREVDKIQTFNLQANRDEGYWQDDGCNTLVIQSVEWFKTP